MTLYKVQTFLDAIGDYDNIVTYTPDYVWSVAKVWRRWWFPWPRIEIGVVKNLRQAEEKALTRALNHARILRRKAKARINRVVTINGKETKTIVWDNGTYLDRTIMPWYWRLLTWPFVKRKKKVKK